MNFEHIKSEIARIDAAGKIPALASETGLSPTGLRKIASGFTVSPRLCTLEAINRAIRRKEFRA